MADLERDNSDLRSWRKDADRALHQLETQLEQVVCCFCEIGLDES